jgi:sugar lactone lactonase YvrE
MGNGYGSKPDQLKFPEGLFIEPKTQIIYVTDAGNNRVQKIYPNGKVATAAGQTDGSAGSSQKKLESPIRTFADENENVYVADWHNQRIQFWEKNAQTGRTVAGNDTDGSALNEFSGPISVWVDSKKNVIVTDYQNQRITQWSPTYDPKKSVGTIIAVSSGCYFVEKNQIYFLF